MGCFFGCFRNKTKQQHLTPPTTTATNTAVVKKARVSQNQLSNLFVAREIEDFSSNGKTASPEIVAHSCDDVIAGKKAVQLYTPAKLSEDQKGLNSSAGTSTSCICDPPTAGRTLVSTTSNNNQIGSLPIHENRPKSMQEDLKVEGSLSAWLKPVERKRVGNRVYFDDELGCTGRAPGDIPILGTVAAYWNDEVRPSQPSKWWDGNGIPNSTTKYREDQKVSWHVTPFEERLEKALSEEKSISQRKHINFNGAHSAFEDSDIDTAASHLQSMPHPKSVVSC